MSLENLDTLWAIPESTCKTAKSTLRVYVCPLTLWHFENPIFSAIFCSNNSTFFSSPSKSSKKLAPVPVVPLHPSSLILSN